MKKPLTRDDFKYMYTPFPRLTIGQKVKCFFAKRKPLFWMLFGSIIYPSLIALMQLLDCMDSVR